MNRSTARNFIIGEVGLECIQMDIELGGDRPPEYWEKVLSCADEPDSGGPNELAEARKAAIKWAAMLIQWVAAIDRRRGDVR